MSPMRDAQEAPLATDLELSSNHLAKNAMHSKKYDTTGATFNKPLGTPFCIRVP